MIAIGSKRTPTTTHNLNSNNTSSIATPSSHLILTSPKNQLNMLSQSNTTKNEINSLPLAKEHRSAALAGPSSQQMVNSQSYDTNLSMHALQAMNNNEISPSVSNPALSRAAANLCFTPKNNNLANAAASNNSSHTPVMMNGNKTTLHNFNKTNLNSPKSRSNATPNLQKYYSFQKPSFNINENKCNCFNMPFVCEVCTTRFV